MPKAKEIIAEYRRMNEGDLNRELAKLRREGFAMRQALMARESKDYGKYRQTKLKIAQILTVLRETKKVDVSQSIKPAA